MKTQIITLESHDDLISVRDRMSWAKTPRILLVWPKFEKVMLRPLDLRILQYHARGLGAELGLVTRRPEMQREAQRLGIPVFDSALAAQRQPWPARHTHHRPLRRRPRPNLRALQQAARLLPPKWMSAWPARLTFFVLGALAALAVAMLFVPHATLRLTPLSQRQAAVIPVRASLSTPSISVAGEVPAHEIRLTVSASQAAQIKSQVALPKDKAGGVARFKNLTQTEISIPAGTMVSTAPPRQVRFITLHDSHLDGKVNAFIEIPIEALEAGSSGNVPANAIQMVDGPLGLSIAVTNPEPTRGGSDAVTLAPSDEDRQRLREALMLVLQSQAQQQARAAMDADDILLTDPPHLERMLEETYDPPPGQAASRLRLTLRAEYRARYVRAEDLRQLAGLILNAGVPASFVALSQSLTFHVSGMPVVDASGEARFTLEAERTLLHAVDVRRAHLLVGGKPPAEAARVLGAHFPLAAPPQIVLQPAWWPWLPLIPFNVEIQLVP